MDALAAVIEEKMENSSFVTEVTSSKSLKVPARHRTQIKCRIKAQSNGQQQTVYFEPLLSPDEGDLTFNETVSELRRGHTNYVIVDVLNLSSKDKWLKKGEVIGSIHTVSAVTPMTNMFDIGKKSLDDDEADSVKMADVAGVQEAGVFDENGVRVMMMGKT